MRKEAMVIPRSVRNNNPGNIGRTHIAWEGLATPDEMTPEQQEETRFAVFSAPEWGFRALARDLHSKWVRGLDTIRKIITVYAPPSENDTEAYIRAVRDRKSTRLNSSHRTISYAVFCLKKKKKKKKRKKITK